MKPNRISRPTVLVTVVVLGLVLANSPSFAGSMVLRVVADTSVAGLDIVPSANGGPFYIPGDILDPDTGDLIGKFHCWGFFFDNFANAVVSQEFELFDRGKIQVQGVEDEGARAVTGGTGEFRNVRGEMTGADLSAFPDFTVTFKLIASRNE